MKTRQAAILLIIIGLLVYFNSLFNGFVWDDEEQVLNNIPVHSIGNIFQFFRESTFNGGGTGTLGGLYYKPLMTTFFSLIYTIFGPNPFFFHLFQVSVHTTSSVLVFLIFKHFLKTSLFLPFILALVFLIHPINTEAVVYISDLQDILFFFFGVFALHNVIHSRFHLRGVSTISILLLASLLSKETGALFFAACGLYVLLFRIKDLGKYALSACTAIGIYGVLRFAVAGIYFNKHGLSPITTMPFTERVLSVPKIIFSYLKTFVFPDNLAINQHWAVKSITWNEFVLPLIIDALFFLLLLAAAIFIWRKKSEYLKAYLFFLGWFVIGLGLHLQFFPLDLTYSDRWFYFPIIGLLGMVGVSLYAIAMVYQTVRQKQSQNMEGTASSSTTKVGISRNDKLWLALAVLVTITLSIRTFIRNMDWKDGLTLYGHDIKIAKDSFDLENNYGVELFRVGRFEEAEIHFEKSTKLAQSWWTNWNNLGVVYEKKGDYKKAKEYYQKAINNGKYYLAYENVAKITFFQENDAKFAKEFIQQSLQLLPNNTNLWFILSLSEYKLGNKEEALKAAKNALILSPTEQNYYLYSRLSQNLPLELK